MNLNKMIQKQVEIDLKKETREIKKLVGKDLDIWAARNIADAFDKLHIAYPRTEKTSEPSFTQNWLINSPHKRINLPGKEVDSC